MNRAFYLLANTLMRFLLWSLTRWETHGIHHVPKEGPLILVANHLSLIDPPILGASFPRPIFFMTKSEAFRNPLLATVIRAYGGFPVRRGERDVRAFQEALRLLRAGQVLGMFPEGTRSRRHQLQRGHPGVALLALRSGAPLVPVAITGTEHLTGPRSLLRRPKITVTVGEAFRVTETEENPGREKLAALTQRIMERIAFLLPEEYRGGYRLPSPVEPPLALTSSPGRGLSGQ